MNQIPVTRREMVGDTVPFFNLVSMNRGQLSLSRFPRRSMIQASLDVYVQEENPEAGMVERLNGD